jgi:hypothetical protein
MEQVIDWLNENEHRAYPLMDNYPKIAQVNDTEISIPQTFLLDLQLRTALNLSSISNVVLKKLRHDATADSFTVTFGAGDNIITEFLITSVSQQVYPLYIRNPDGCLGVFGAGLQGLLLDAPTDTDILANIPVEPSTCVQFNDAWFGVSSLSTAPEKTTVLGSLQPKLPLEAIAHNSRLKLKGDVVFAEGYNFYVSIFENLIDLGVGRDYGKKMSCETSFIGEEYLDCHELISYINGVPPDENGNFKLEAGTNISITPGLDITEAFVDNFSENANEHSLFVGMTFSAEDICTPLNLRPSR